MSQIFCGRGRQLFVIEEFNRTRAIELAEVVFTQRRKGGKDAKKTRKRNYNPYFAI